MFLPFIKSRWACWNGKLKKSNEMKKKGLTSCNCLCLAHQQDYLQRKIAFLLEKIPYRIESSSICSCSQYALLYILFFYFSFLPISKMICYYWKQFQLCFFPTFFIEYLVAIDVVWTDTTKVKSKSSLLKKIFLENCRLALQVLCF